MMRWWVLLALGLAACDDEGGGGAGGSGGQGGAGGDLPDVAAPVGGMGGSPPPQDMAPPPPVDMAPPPRDMAPPVDMAPPMDLGPPPPDMAPLGDVGPLDGDPCDPRLRAAACPPGFYCQHRPGAQPQFGNCQQGDGCRPGVAEDCPDPARPYCHLKGGATVCTAAGMLQEGERCFTDDYDRGPQACADGLVCNFSVCQRPCTVGGPPEQCPDEGRCADVSARVGVALGLCAPRGCNWFDGTGCMPGEKCAYSIRAGGVVVGSCFPEQGQNMQDTPCAFGDRGGDNCAQGLLCVGPPDQERFCKYLCDTGAYEAPCPERYTCREALATREGPVRGYGICFINQ